MQFNSLQFMLFFPAVLAVYYIIPSGFRKIWLLISSYVFYMGWNVKYSALMAATTLITYAGGLILQKTGDSKKRKLILGLSIGVNLLILCVFKYANLFISTADRAMGALRIGSLNIRSNLLLPIGISFYTFQAIGYIIDVYRRDIEAEKNLISYALFVSFFPQLVAGPIERSRNLLKQVNSLPEKKIHDLNRLTSGLVLMIWGLFVKMVIADRLAIPADTVFNDIPMYGSTELIFGILCFTMQIYCDFYSYSIIAMGSAHILGVSLMENFNTPYFAENIGDFWNRWHISLSTWFRDYVYIPLGGNRKGRLRTSINKIAVFMLSGLWHGASWHFMVWGGIHGIYQVCSDMLKPLKKRFCEKHPVNTGVFSFKLLKVGITFIMVSTAWIFFRADSLSDAVIYLKGIIMKPDPWVLTDQSIYRLGLDRTEMNILIFGLLIFLTVSILRYKKGKLINSLLLTQNLYFIYAVMVFMIFMIFVYGIYGPSYDAHQFIYFQF